MSARVVAAGLVGAGVAVGLVGLGVWLARPRAPHELVIDAPETWWAENGFVALAPPVHLPESAGDRGRTVVWLKLPEGAAIDTVAVSDPRGFTLDFPPGTVADRVEYWRPNADAPLQVADVRGVRVEADGRQVFRVFRPREARPGAALYGYEWARGDAEAKARVHAAITARMEAGSGFAWPSRPEGRQKAIAGYLGKSGCATCHTPDRPDVLVGKSAIGVQRGTDHSGFFVPQTLLRDDAPLESYRTHDPNADDPCVRVTCGDAVATPTTTPAGGKRFRCANGAVPRGRFDLDCAVRAADGHGAAVCASRRVLYDHLDEPAREHFRAAFEACGLAAPPT